MHVSSVSALEVLLNPVPCDEQLLGLCNHFVYMNTAMFGIQNFTESSVSLTLQISLVFLHQVHTIFFK
jgi:hypothetical protein